MATISRRTFLLMAGTSIAGYALTSTNNENFQHSEFSSKYDSRHLSECREVLRVWKISEPTDPLTYIQTSRLSTDPNMTLSQLTKLDFETNNLITVNGLVLGKTEAAMLALLA